MHKKRILTKKRRIWLIVIILLISTGFAVYHIREMGYRLSSYVAKQACSLVFITQQPLDDVLSELQEDNPFIKHVDVQLNQQPPEITASIMGWFQKKAVYRPPLGATLTYPEYEKTIENFPLPEFTLESGDAANTPTFDQIREANNSLWSRIKQPELAKAFDYAFAEPDDEQSRRRTRAALVVWYDYVIAEKYHQDFGPDSLLLGWSMSKSVLNLMIGRHVQLGGDMSLEAAGLRKEWLQDDRKSITLEQLLRMEGGLSFDESYSPLADVLTMLYRKPDMGTYAASFEKESSTGKSIWYYSSGTSNILSQQLRRSFSTDRQYVQFIWQDFLLPLRIRNAQLEFDASGTWVGSSYMYATARDWARIGKIVLDNGKWDGQQFLPLDWIKQSIAPTASYRENRKTGDPPGLCYGMHWWLNRKDANGRNWMPSVPEDAIIAWGHFGQYITVIPSRRLIVVRLGLSKGPKGWDLGHFLTLVLAALRIENLDEIQTER